DRHPNLPVVVVTPAGRFHDAAVKALVLGAATFVPRDRLARDLVTTVERIVSLCCANGAPTVGVLAETSHRYTLGNDRDAVAPVLRHVQSELERFGVCDRPDRLRVAVAVEEALINAIVHGNLEVSSRLRERGDDAFEREIAGRKAERPYRDRVARLTATFRPGEATFVVSDEGPGFDPSDVPDPTDPENLVKPYGRGLLLMRTFMSDVRHNAKGNEVTLVKRAPASWAEATESLPVL
ncbi:MAG TPA: ATP-binding protein, partial [Planctomycetaceae bacterium]